MEGHTQQRINCLNCRHFYITWDKNFPRGCRAHGFKSQHLPSRVVFNSSGIECMYYQKKREKTKTETD